MFKASFSKAISDSILIKKNLLCLSNQVNHAVNEIYKSLKKGGKIMLCGNGGSCADALHLAAEFTVRLRPNVNRSPISAVALSNDPVSMSACSNDYQFKNIFVRNFEALYKKNDVLIVLTTSGNSENIIKVLKFAKKNKIKTIGFLGSRGGVAKKYCNIKLMIGSSITARIQEMHIFLGHFIFQLVEEKLFSK